MTQSDGKVSIEIPDDLSPEDRTLIASALYKDGQYYTISTPAVSPEIPEPTVKGLVERITRDRELAAQKDAEREAKKAAEDEQRRQIVAERVASRRTITITRDAWSNGERVTYKETQPETFLGNPPSPEAAEWLAELHALNYAVKLAAEAELARRIADKEAAAEQERIERQAWIAERGSPRLQRLVAEKIDHDGVYFSERFALERPGWRAWYDIPGEQKEPRNATEDALNLLDTARIDEPSAKLVYVTVDHDCTDACPYDPAEKCSKYDWTGYAALAEYLGKTIVFGGPPA